MQGSTNVLDWHATMPFRGLESNIQQCHIHCVLSILQAVLKDSTDDALWRLQNSSILQVCASDLMLSKQPQLQVRNTQGTVASLKAGVVHWVGHCSHSRLCMTCNARSSKSWALLLMHTYASHTQDQELLGVTHSAPLLLQQRLSGVCMAAQPSTSVQKGASFIVSGSLYSFRGQGA